jgi:hypothetical protein
VFLIVRNAECFEGANFFRAGFFGTALNTEGCSFFELVISADDIMGLVKLLSCPFSTDVRLCSVVVKASTGLARTSEARVENEGRETSPVGAGLLRQIFAGGRG